MRDYLQKEIEGQLRILLMDELPAIIHRLSLRLWVPEYRAREERETVQEDQTPQEEPVVDPFASPPQDPVDSHGHKLNPSEIASLSIETGIETQSLFSQKNLLRLAALTDSHKTLSLFTPSIQGAVFRAWAGPTERGELGGLRSPIVSPALSRSHSYSPSINTACTFDSAPQGRPALQSFGSHSYSLSMGGGRHGKAHGARRRKKRVVDLRRKAATDDSEPVNEDLTSFSDSASMTESTGSAPSIFSAPPDMTRGFPHEDIEPVTPPRSPHATIKPRIRAEIRTAVHDGEQLRSIGQQQPPRSLASAFDTVGPRKGFNGSQELEAHGHDRNSKQETQIDLDSTPRASTILAEKPEVANVRQQFHVPSSNDIESKAGPSSPSQNAPLPNFLQFITDPANGGTIVEQAWMMKMAGEIARRYQEEREKGSLGAEAEAPPAYVG